MKQHGSPDGDGRLRRILRRGDPAGDGNDPSPAEVDRLRRRILAQAARDRARRPARPGWRWAAAAALAVVGVLLAWKPLTDRPSAPATRAQALPVVEEPAPAVRTPADVAPPPPPARGPEPPTVAARVAEPDTPATGPALSREAAGPRKPPSSRQMQFVTARGTRIIWTLNPDLDLGSLESPEKGEPS